MMIMRGIAAAVAASFSIAGAAKSETLTVTSALPPGHMVEKNAIGAFMECVTEASGGDIDFNYFPSGQLANVENTVDTVQNGLADIGFISASNEASKLPLTGVTMMPGLSSTALELIKAWRQTYTEGGLLADELNTLKLHPLIMSTLPPYQMMSKVDMKTLDQMQGKKVRVAGGTLSFSVSTLGAVPVEMSAADLYVSLQRGTIDATLLSMSSAESYALDEVLTQVSRNGSFGTSTQMYAISTSSWNKLSEEQQTMMDTCGHDVEQTLGKMLDETESQLMDDYAARGVEVVTYDDETKAAIEKALSAVANDYVRRMNERDLPAQEALNEFKAALAD